MENASKALLIAGAILVCILLIGIGMLVYTSTQGTISEAVAQMSSQEKDIFNSQFEQYAGSRVNGSSVKALLQKVRSNNSANKGIDGKVIKVTSDNNVKVNTDSDGVVSDFTSLNTARNYEVKVIDTNSDGLVDTIEIKAQVSTP